MAESKKAKKERIKQIKEQFRAVRGARRKDEIEDHNGKPFTSKNLPVPKIYKRSRHKENYDEY